MNHLSFCFSGNATRHMQYVQLFLNEKYQLGKIFVQLYKAVCTHSTRIAVFEKITASQKIFIKRRKKLIQVQGFKAATKLFSKN